MRDTSNGLQARRPRVGLALCAAVGLDAATIDDRVRGGQVVTAALAV